jgi:hypothetical protein
MLLPDDWLALAEWRREELERETRLQMLSAELPRSPARWRLWTGSSMVWAGARLVYWGEQMVAIRCGERIEIA